jgi:hypothetical protein
MTIRKKSQIIFVNYSSTPYEMEPDSNIKRCPRCRFPLEWIAGCAQIMCVNCKHIFCWYCLQSLDVNIKTSISIFTLQIISFRMIFSYYISNEDLVEIGRFNFLSKLCLFFF